jgi:hypothetical protein
LSAVAAKTVAANAELLARRSSMPCDDSGMRTIAASTPLSFSAE